MDYFFQAAQPNFGLLSGLFLALSVLVLGAGAYLLFVGRNRWRSVHKLNYRVAGFWGQVGLILGAAGVLFYIFRALSIEGLNMRFWLYLVMLIMAGFALYGGYYFSRIYPAKLAEFSRTHKARAAGPVERPTRTAPTRSVDTGATVRAVGPAGNPRGTSERGERRREKKK